MLRKLIIPALLAASIMCLSAFTARADIRPGWVDRHEDALNKQRTNDTYEFKVIRSEDTYLDRLMAERFVPLFQYLAEKYDTDVSKMVLDSLSVPGELPTYRVSFTDKEGPATVIARLYDEYDNTDYNVTRYPVFELYQLFAIGEKNSAVIFDDYSEKEASKALAGVLSIVPGLGQLYKGNTAKGIAMLGTGVAVAGCAVASQLVGNSWKKQLDGNTGNKDSWESKVLAMKRQRNVLIGAFGILSAYSIFDAIVGDENPRVVVSESDGNTISVGPSSQSAGISLVLAF